LSFSILQGVQTCGTVIQGSSSVSEYPKDVEIKLKTKNNFNYNLKKEFTLKLRVKTVGPTPSYWKGTFNTPVDVRIQNRNCMCL